MNFIGEYQSDRAHALVECSGTEDSLITIEWGGSAAELARWDIFGRLNTETLTINYSGVTKSIVTYDDSGEIVSQEPCGKMQYQYLTTDCTCSGTVFGRTTGVREKISTI